MELDALPDFAATFSGAPGRLVRGSRHGIVRITRRFKASRERVFDAWLDPKIARQWLFATALRPMARVTLDARVGGSFCFLYRDNGQDAARTGKYLEIVRPQRLCFTLASENRPQVTTRVTVEIVKLRTGCELGVTHEDVPPDCAVQTKNRWAGMLYGLGETLRGLPPSTKRGPQEGARFCGSRPSLRHLAPRAPCITVLLERRAAASDNTRPTHGQEESWQIQRLRPDPSASSRSRRKT